MFVDIDVGEPTGTIVSFQRLPGGRVLALGSRENYGRAGFASDSITFILKSDDEASTWDTLSCGLPWSCGTFVFTSDTIGWLGSSTDRIYKTTDGGATWILQYSDSVHSSPIKSLSSPDGVNIFAVDGTNHVLSSRDGGEHWNSTQVDQNYSNQLPIAFASPTKGFVGGAGFSMTTDGGATWKRISKSLAGSFTTIDFISENFGMGVGGKTIYRTLDGGRSWTVLCSSTSQYFSGLDMVDSLNVWATGSDSIFHSTDGGNSWSSVFLNGDVEYMRGIQFLNSTVGIVFEVWGRDSTFNYVTTDGGESWSKRTINNRQFLPSFNKLRFTDAQHLWFVNQDGVWLSQDTARTWTVYPVDGSFEAYDFLDSANGWTALWGGQWKKMAYTTDGGRTWQLVDRPFASQTQDMFLYREHYSGGIIALAAGYDGTLTQFMQQNGYAYAIPTYTGVPLYKFASYRNGSTLHIWLAGDGMTVLHYVAYVVGVQQEARLSINSYSLFQNYPNPFNPSTLIQYTIPRQARVRLTVHDILGRQVAQLEDGVKQAGRYEVHWNASAFPSGVYFYRLQAGSFSETKKLLLLK
jgi:photosystem II stability/assembly factor-like uncharacterized protein